MADDEVLRLRDLPAVAPVGIYDRGRMSQTLLAKADACLRSAYLYLKYNGGPGSHAMDRGSVVHEGAERIMLDLIRHEEKSMLELALHQGPGDALVAEDIVQAEGGLASMTKAIVDEILEQRHDLNPTSLEADAARAMVWHIALGLDVDPATVLGVERKFVLDLECGVTVSGKIDLLSTPDVRWIQVDDYKTTFSVPPEEEFDELHSFQTKLYALLAVFGNPVEKRPCPMCDGAGWEAVPDLVSDPTGETATQEECATCMGRGTIEERLPNLGDGVWYARGRQLYPRARLRELPDGRKELVQRERVFTRTELADFRIDVERIAKRLLAAYETWKFPAIPGRHCSECPASAECPLPAQLRRYGGIVDSHDRAAEALAWAMTQKDRVAATEKEVKAWAKHHGPIALGGELYGWEVVPTERSFRTKGGKSLRDAMIARAVEVSQYGGSFDPDEFLRPASTKNAFGPLKASSDVVARRREEIAGAGREPEPVDLERVGELEQPPGADVGGNDVVG